MKRNVFLRLCLMLVALLSLNSCRQEYLQADAENQKQQYQVTLLNRQEVSKIAPLMGKLSELKKKSFKQSNGLSARKVQDSILEGAIIGTSQVLLVENGNHKTYTFPVSRGFISNKTESLVLRQNADNTFTGILIQYDITQQEKDQFLSGQNVDISSKTKIYDIENINLNASARVQVDIVGCYKITWETGWCSAGVHYTGGPGGCTVGGAPAPFIQSIENVCEGGTDDGGVTGGNDGGGAISVGSGVDLGGYFTIPFISIGHQYYETEDDFDPNYVHYTQVVNYFSSLGTTLNQLRVSNPDLFYYTFYYFKDNGINPTTKAFITQRLVGLNAWYEAVNNNPNASPANNQYFLNWAYKYLVLNPDITWDEFYEEYLQMPCEQLNKIKDKPGFTNKMGVLKSDIPSGTEEKGFIIRDIPNQDFSTVVQGGGYDGGVMYPFKDQTPQDLEELYKTIGTAHNHLASNPNHIGVFTPEDIGGLFYLGMFQTYTNNPYREDFPKKVIMYVITDKGLFALKINDFNQLKTFATWWSDMVLSDKNNGTTKVEDYVNKEFSNSEKYNISHTSTKTQQITGFLRFIKDKNIGIDMYEGNKDTYGDWKKLTLKPYTGGEYSYNEEPCN